mmetsp:Transcript_45058/g.174863  ORF Transcript_45058/g.174863 Transcript_45058/m.174863 type:complete len:97 (-) Transcript_45058:215-505(-)
MGSSLSGSWSALTLGWYGREILHGRLPQRIQEDPNQLGGDFVVNQQDRTMLLHHPSSTPIDRPSVRDVLRSVDPHLALEDHEVGGSAEDPPDACAL